ncbi:MAG: NAD-dependent epimerase/dehydratase family protein [Candidatus Micrarchaeaceae archaeon]
MDLGSKTFFISGGAGFIGSSMVSSIISSGASVTVYDNLSSGKYEFIETFKDNKKFRFVKADLLNTDRLNEEVLAARPDAIIHLAANPDVRLGAKVTDLDLKQGTEATYNILEAARRADVSDILFASSSVVYGIAGIKPTPEDYGPLKPISLYGASKLACEGLVTSFGHLFGMKYWIYRFANVVGVNGTHGVILDFLSRLRQNSKDLEVLGDGKQRKSYIDVKDCVDSMISIYGKSTERENIFNLATDDQISVEEIAKMVIDATFPGAKIKYTGTSQGWPGDVPDTYLSNERMKSLGITLKYTKSRAVVENAIKVLIGQNK